MRGLMISMLRQWSVPISKPQTAKINNTEHLCCHVIFHWKNSESSDFGEFQVTQNICPNTSRHPPHLTKARNPILIQRPTKRLQSKRHRWHEGDLLCWKQWMGFMGQRTSRGFSTRTSHWSADRRPWLDLLVFNVAAGRFPVTKIKS